MSANTAKTALRTKMRPKGIRTPFIFDVTLGPAQPFLVSLRRFTALLVVQPKQILAVTVVMNSRGAEWPKTALMARWQLIMIGKSGCNTWWTFTSSASAIREKSFFVRTTFGNI